MDEAWAMLRVCDETERVDLLNLLDDGVVPHRERAYDERDLALAVPQTGVRSHFGADRTSRIVIEVPAVDLARAQQILRTHYAELARAVEGAAGAGISTPEERAVEEHWMEARRSRSYRTSKIMAWSLCAMLAALAVAVVYLELRG